MRRYLVALICLIVLGSISATAAPVSCTIRGTNNADILYGTSRADHICGYDGNDYEKGRAGADLLGGGKGKDLLVGAKGQDTIRGKRGNDRLLGVDGQPSDHLFGGPGHDVCHVDLGDMVNNCESIDVAKPLLTDKLMVVEFSPQLVTWLQSHGYWGGGKDGARR